MGEVRIEVLDRFEVDAAVLMAKTPPRWVHSHKIAVAARTCPPGAIHSGVVRYARYHPVDVELIRMRQSDLPRVEVLQGVMDYQIDAAEANPGERVQHWQMNFADGELFVAYGSSLLAQDEWQVLEHPALGALREYMRSHGWSTRIVSGRQESCISTPVLVEGVERRCCFTANVLRDQRSVALYGRRFAVAAEDDVIEAVEVLEPPRCSNIVAIAAPAYGSGAYTHEQIGNILSGCAAGFGACVQHASATGARAVINTGFWGCGAFGGNRVLMVALQILAAGATGVPMVRLFSMDAAGLSAIAKGQQLARELVDTTDQLSGAALVDALAARRFMWGQSDGN